MVVKLNALDRWMLLESGKAIGFVKTGDTARRVRLEVNCAAPTVFHIENEDGPRLLAAVPAGLEVIEFSMAGDFAVFPQEGAGEVHYRTAEAEPTHHVVVNPVVFTKLAQRRHRNPELEAIMYRMQENMERRLAAQHAETQAALAAMAKRNANNEPAPAPAPSSPTVEPEPTEPEPGENAGSEDGS